MSKSTIQADVGPGDATGVYYITICNLPFGTTWQQLKDWTRTVCDVEHVEVFENSTSGWVRVRGKDNFQQAWGLLNGGIFEGRAIIASDKNRNASIKIKELVDCSVRPSSKGNRPAAMNQEQQRLAPPKNARKPQPSQPPSNYSISHGAQYYPDNHLQSTRRYPTKPSGPMLGYPPLAIPRTTTNPAIHGIGGAMNPTAAAYSPQPYYYNRSCNNLTSYRSQTDQLATVTGAPNAQLAGNKPRDCTVAERKKIFVKQLSFNMSPDDVKSFIRSKVGTLESRISQIEVPLGGDSDRQNRGHAFVLFMDEDAAEKAVVLLDRQPAPFGRWIHARLTFEGVTAGELFGSSKQPSRRQKNKKDGNRKGPGHGWKSRKGGAEDAPRTDGTPSPEDGKNTISKQGQGQGRGQDQGPVPSVSGPVIVDGSFGKQSGRTILRATKGCLAGLS